MRKNQQSEALRLADIVDRLNVGVHSQAIFEDYSAAARELRRLHARNQELEAMLNAVGAGGVSAQRVTQAADHIVQDRKIVAAPVVLPEPEAEVVECSGDYPFQDGTNDEISVHLPVGTKLYTEQQVRDLLDKAACTKSQVTSQEPFGYFKAEPFG